MNRTPEVIASILRMHGLYLVHMLSDSQPLHRRMATQGYGQRPLLCISIGDGWDDNCDLDDSVENSAHDYAHVLHAYCRPRHGTFGVDYRLMPKTPSGAEMVFFFPHARCNEADLWVTTSDLTGQNIFVYDTQERDHEVITLHEGHLLQWAIKEIWKAFQSLAPDATTLSPVFGMAILPGNPQPHSGTDRHPRS